MHTKRPSCIRISMGYNVGAMRPKNLLFALLATLFFSRIALAKDDFAPLKGAAKDPLKLERVALSMGAPRLSRALLSPDADVVLAAITIAPEMQYRTLLIAPLTTVAEKQAPALA